MKKFNQCTHCNSITSKPLEQVKINSPFMIHDGEQRDSFNIWIVCQDCIKKFEDD